MVRVLHIFSALDRGGAEMRTFELLRHLDRSRFHCDFVAASGRLGELDDEIRTLGAQVHHLSLGLNSGRAFRDLFQAGKYDVVHSHLWHTTGLILRWAQQAGVPGRIAHYRNSSDGQPTTVARQAQRRFLAGLVNRHATHILAVAGAALDGCWPGDWRGDARCRVIYNGLDLQPFQHLPPAGDVRREFGIPDGAPFVAHVGNMRPQKNHARLLRIFIELAQRQPEARLLLIGKGGNDIENDLRTMALRAGVSEKIQFAGVRDDVPRLLGAADVLLFPSSWEGLPGVALESCAAGTPVVASALPVMEEIAPLLPQNPPLVRAVPLRESDAAWCEAIAAARTAFASREVRQASAAEFAGGPFTIARCLNEHEKVWTEAAQR